MQRSLVKEDLVVGCTRRDVVAEDVAQAIGNGGAGGRSEHEGEARHDGVGVVPNDALANARIVLAIETHHVAEIEHPVGAVTVPLAAETHTPDAADAGLTRDEFAQKRKPRQIERVNLSERPGSGKLPGVALDADAARAHADQRDLLWARKAIVNREQKVVHV